MDDQGEKIIFLARELLRANAQVPPAPRKKLDITMTFRTLCLTTLIAAAGGGAATAAMHRAEKPLDRYQKTEIDALVFYAAKMKGYDAEGLEREVAQKVGIADYRDMTQDEFPAARLFLQEKAQR